MKNKPKGHVIVLPYPAQGHINPLLQFAKVLVTKGLKATLATTPYTINHIHEPTVAIEPISDGYDEGGFTHAPSVESYIESFRSAGSKTLSELIIKLRHSSCAVNCIVYDSMLTWALDVAKQFGIYGAVFLTNSASVCSIYWEMKLGNLFFPLEKWVFPISIPGLPPLGVSDLPSFVARPDDHKAYLDAIMGIFETLKNNDWVFCNTFQELESEALDGTWPVVPVGPMVPSAYLHQQNSEDTAYGATLWNPTINKSYMTWLGTKPPRSVVYVSFGSMATTTAKQAEEIANGLKASKKNFIWVVKESWEILPKGFMSGLGDAGLVVTWCNQLEVLAHPAVGCFVTHCGWNSVLEALSIGVPMVTVAQWSDQPTNAKLVEVVWGVGTRAEKDSDDVLSGKELEKCIGEVMDAEKSEDLKRNASKWSQSASRAASVGGTSDKNINEFVKILMLPKGENN
ncbi:UDP-glycosyltransferase 74B1 [Arachis duranensis]|uniref:Glycosyltransferase n=1 Tax=Arachis duranensis TaxID=130453 RepID=A0A6P4DPK9_ARADU|nr:UDP-glycosyltransferase 74B1 [Arachis duranensis]